MIHPLERIHFLLHPEQSRELNRQRAGLAAPTEHRRAAMAAMAPSDQIPTDPSVVWGVDWSGQWNGIPDLRIFKARGGRFTLIKIADGTVPCKDWEQNVDNSQSLDLVTGGYYWLYKNANIAGTRQAQAWWNLVKYKGLHFHVVDYEWTWWLYKLSNPSQSDLQAAAEPFEQLCGQKMWVYSAPAYLSEHPLPSTGGRRLIIANYNVMHPVDTPPWPTDGYSMHQCSESWNAQELGFKSTDCTAADGDIFNGDVQHFYSLFPSIPVVPVEEPIVLKYPRGSVLFHVTPGTSSLMLLQDAVAQAQRYGWSAAMNAGAGHTYPVDKPAYAEIKGFAAEAGHVFAEGIGELTLFADPDGTLHDNMGAVWTAIPYSRRAMQNGVVNPDLDTVYKAPWSMLGISANEVQLIVTRGQEGMNGWTQAEAAEWACQHGVTELYLFDSGHSTQIEQSGTMLYTAYGESIPLCLGITIIGGNMAQAQELLGKTVTVRSSPEVISGNDTSKRILPYAVVEYSEIVDDKQHPGNQDYRWLKLTDGSGYVNYYYPSSTQSTLPRFKLLSAPPETTEDTFHVELVNTTTGKRYAGDLKLVA